jgi:hypothetical protein
LAFSDDELRAKLTKLEALFRRAGTAGERDAAGAAIDRLKGRLGDGQAGPEVELKFSFPDSWAVRLFLAVCRKHGLRPYRYRRQRHTTIMVRAREREFDAVVWPEFSSLLSELTIYFEEIVDHLVTEAMKADADDAEEVAQLGR